MRNGDSVRKCIDDWEIGDTDSAMMHACNAVDSTGKQTYPRIAGSLDRFARIVRDNYDVVGAFGMPGIALPSTNFPVQLHPGGDPQWMSVAEMLYRVHRCSHGHGEELPSGFVLIPEAIMTAGRTSFYTSVKGELNLSDRIIFGLLAAVILAPTNQDERVPKGYHLRYAGVEYEINEWWGRKPDFLQAIAYDPSTLVPLDFSAWRKPAGLTREGPPQTP